MAKIDLNDINKDLNNNPKGFFNTLGGLHDSKINIVTINIYRSNIELLIDDLYANFIGFPEYRDVKNVFFPSFPRCTWEWILRVY